jgi:hypothetical protein
VNNREFFRPRGSVVAAVLAYLLLGGMAIESIYSSGLMASWIALAWCTLFALGIYIILHRPCVEIFDEGIRISNPLSTILIGWQDVDVVEAKYTAFLQLRNGVKVSMWAAQAPGRYHSRTIHSSEVKGLQLDGFIRPGESPRTDSGVATYLCRTRLAAFRDRGRSDGLSYLHLREDALIFSFLANVLAIAALIIFHS